MHDWFGKDYYIPSPRINPDSPSMRPDLAGNEAKKCCLAGTARTHDRGHLAAWYIDVETGEDWHWPTRIPQVSDLNYVVRTLVHADPCVRLASIGLVIGFQ